MEVKSITYGSTFSLLASKGSDYLQLIKFRLSSTVVFSSVIAYAIASHETFLWSSAFMIFLGGFLITAGANAFNQILEKDYDKLMRRTQARPLAANRMNMPEAILAGGLSGIGGILILWICFNTTGAFLGAISLLLYAFVYTPLKRISPFAVLVGAIPGAMPPLIGWVCVTGTISYEAILLFSIQFLWQFPHFWAIAWIANDDYRNAGFKLLPSTGGQDKYTALLNIFYILILTGVSMIPLFMGMIGYISAAVILLMGLIFLYQAIRLYQTCAMKQAKVLMFGSIVYLPVVLIALLMGKIF